jgi:hypothetical protein
VDKTSCMADIIDCRCGFSVVAREFTVDGNLPLIRNTCLRNSDLQADERPRTHGPIGNGDFSKGGTEC